MRTPPHIFIGGRDNPGPCRESARSATSRRSAMAGSDQQGDRDDHDIRESVNAFRQAGSAVSDGFRILSEWGHNWVERRHLLVQFLLVGTVWFAGNWTYNRIAPPMIAAITTLANQFPSEIGPVLSFLRGNPVFVSVQIVLLLVVVVATQNQMHTRRLNMIESKSTTMSSEPREVPDGGKSQRDIPSDWTICGVVCGAIIGSWFGPGGVLAGMYLGFWRGSKLDRRVYENDPLTPDLNQKAKPEQ